MSQFPSETAEKKAKKIMESLKGMTIYDVKDVLEIITQNIERVANGTIYEPFGINYHFDQRIASDIITQTILKASRPNKKKDKE